MNPQKYQRLYGTMIYILYNMLRRHNYVVLSDDNVSLD